LSVKEIEEPVEMSSINSDALQNVMEKLETSQTLSTSRMMYSQNEGRKMIVDYYETVTGSRDIAALILQEAYTQNVPFSLAFAVAYVESRFDPRAVNKNSRSIDRGLFQLNNRSFPELKEKEFFNTEINAGKGVAYLKWCLKHGGNEVKALAFYNAGIHRVQNQGTPEMTLTYIFRVLSQKVSYESGLTDFTIIPSTEIVSAKSASMISSLIELNKEL